MKLWLFYIICFILYSSVSISQSNNNVILEFSNIRNTTGYIRVGVYKDQLSFKNETPYFIKSFSKENITDGKISFRITLETGIYGIAFLDDENENEIMDYSFFIPLEGYGFSNYIHSGFQSPDFDDFKFRVSLDNDSNIDLFVKYY